MNQDSFFSVDRLVEFGLGLAIAQQMSNSMNTMLENTKMPGAMDNFYVAPTQGPYFVMIDGKQAGPFSEEEISRLIAQEMITKTTYVWKPGMIQWNTAENVPEILKIVALTPPPFNPGV